MQFGQSCVCVGNRNDFHVFSTSIVVAHMLQRDANWSSITPDYTRLHPITPYFEPRLRYVRTSCGASVRSRNPQLAPTHWHAITPTIGGRPAQELAGDYPKNRRSIIPSTGGRPSQELAAKNRRAIIPRTSGRPSQELAGDHPKSWRVTIPRTGGRPSQ